MLLERESPQDVLFTVRGKMEVCVAKFSLFFFFFLLRCLLIVEFSECTTSRSRDACVCVCHKMKYVENARGIPRPQYVSVQSGSD